MKKRHVDRLHVFVLALAAMMVASALQAVEVTPEQAQTAVGNWIRLTQARKRVAFRSTAVRVTDTARDTLGRAIYHAVNLEGGGFVVTSGDTRLTPLVAFSDTGCFCGDKDNPLSMLLQSDRTKAVSIVNGLVSNGTS